RALWPGRHRAVHRVRRLAARADRARAGGARAGAAARARLRRRRGRARPRGGRAAPPARALLRRADRGRRHGRAARARPGDGRGAARGPPRLATRSSRVGTMSASRLRPPAARQGPGPLPQGLIAGLDLVIARRAAGALPGDRRAAGLGAGTELAQLRPYEVGDDVRQLDPAATARTGIPHVRLHVPERTLTTWLVIDVSPSMAFGTADRLKWDVA